MSFQILVPGRFVECKDIIRPKMRAEGVFTLRAIKGGKMLRERKFKNLITDWGMNGFGGTSVNNLYRAFHLGTGTAPPQFSDMQLQNRIGGFTANSSRSPGQSPNFIATTTFTGQSSIGQLGNANLTEIGIGNFDGSGLVSRALIADSQGNPIAFPITDEELLQVSYELRLHPPLEDEVFEVDFNGLREAIVRPASITDSNVWGFLHAPNSPANMSFANGFPLGWHTGDLAAITSVPSGRLDGSTSGTASSSPYVNDSFKREGTYNYGTTFANSPNLRTHLIGNFCSRFQVQYDPPLAKTNEQTMFCSYEISWGRQ